jgi:DNA-binding response OmpR family regulator
MPDHSRKHMDVLVADDDESLLFGYGKLFAHVNLRADVASTVEEAIELIRNVSYRVIVTDLRFGAESHEGGFEIVTHARRFSPETRVIMVTAYDSPETRRRAGELGVDGYLEKPIRFTELFEMMKSLGV